MNGSSTFFSKTLRIIPKPLGPNSKALRSTLLIYQKKEKTQTNYLYRGLLLFNQVIFLKLIFSELHFARSNGIIFYKLKSYISCSIDFHQKGCFSRTFWIQLQDLPELLTSIFLMIQVGSYGDILKHISIMT